MVFVDFGQRKYNWSLAGVPVNYRGLVNIERNYTFYEDIDDNGLVTVACEMVIHKFKEKVGNAREQ